MKIQCNACEVAEAKVLCCADEAVLCLGCNHKIHAANKLAMPNDSLYRQQGRFVQHGIKFVPRVEHKLSVKEDLSNTKSSMYWRVMLKFSNKMLRCDICQEVVGYFFCLEDRALLCRKCDIAIHTANTYVSSHQRFLLTGVKVELEATEPCISKSSKEKLSSLEIASESASSRSIPRSTVIDHCSSGEIKDKCPREVGGIKTLVSDKISLNQTSTTSVGTIPGWQLEDYLGLTDPNQNYGCLNVMPSEVYESYCA